jgi:tetratricopeptide (TPR) repeat protein
LSWGAAHAGYITPNACVLTGAGAARLDRREESRRRLQECLERYASASPLADSTDAGPRSRWDRCSYGPLLLTRIDYWLSGVAEPERRLLTDELTALTPDCDRYWRRSPAPTTAPEALAAAKTAVADSPDDASAWIQQAAAELRAGDAQRAEVSLSSAERLGPSAADWRRMAIVYQDSGRADKAVAILDRLIADDPADPALWSDRGLCQQMLGRAPAAIRDLRKSISLDPAWLPAILTLGSLYADQGRYRDAVRVYDGAPRPPRDRPEPLREQLLRARAYARARLSAAGR